MNDRSHPSIGAGCPVIHRAAPSNYDPAWDPIPPSWLAKRFIQLPRWLLTALRETPIVGPLPWLPASLDYRLIARYDEVVEVLSRPDVFNVGFASEMARLNDGAGSGTPFILGMDDRREHDAQLVEVMRAFTREAVERDVTPQAYAIALEQVQRSLDAGGPFDAIGDLITAVPVGLCARYYGLDIPEDDRVRFAYATFAIGGHLFGLPPSHGTDADAAADYLRSFVDAAIDREVAASNVRVATNRPARTPPEDKSVVEKLVRIRKGEGPLRPADRRQIRAFLMGMVVGFVPTNTMAGGHMLEVLLNHSEWLETSCKAARAGDDELLERCLFEALRFMPINPGPFRICAADYVIAADTPRATLIRKGTKVWALTMSAMFDPRRVERPGEFLPGRAASDHLHFGVGMHHCAGLFIARAQLTQTFKVLLSQQVLKRRTRLGLRGSFPQRLLVDLRPGKG